MIPVIDSIEALNALSATLDARDFEPDSSEIPEVLPELPQSLKSWLIWQPAGEKLARIVHAELHAHTRPNIDPYESADAERRYFGFDRLDKYSEIFDELSDVAVLSFISYFGGDFPGIRSNVQILPTNTRVARKIVGKLIDPRYVDAFRGVEGLDGFEDPIAERIMAYATDYLAPKLLAFRVVPTLPEEFHDYFKFDAWVESYQLTTYQKQANKYMYHRICWLQDELEEKQADKEQALAKQAKEYSFEIKQKDSVITRQYVEISQHMRELVAAKAAIDELQSEANQTVQSAPDAQSIEQAFDGRTPLDYEDDELEPAVQYDDEDCPTGSYANDRGYLRIPNADLDKLRPHPEWIAGLYVRLHFHAFWKNGNRFKLAQNALSGLSDQLYGTSRFQRPVNNGLATLAELGLIKLMSDRYQVINYSPSSDFCGCSRKLATELPSDADLGAYCKLLAVTRGNTGKISAINLNSSDRLAESANRMRNAGFLEENQLKLIR